MEPINDFPNPIIREGMKRLGIGWFRPTCLLENSPVKETIFLTSKRWKPVMTQVELKEQQQGEVETLLEEHGGNMSDWERNFLESIHKQLEASRRNLSSKQAKVLGDIGEKYI